jgi:hypothetical protein
MMALVLKYSHRYRPIISLPYSFGMMQGFVMEKLPVNMLTITRGQVVVLSISSSLVLIVLPSKVEQLKSDNIVTSPSPLFKSLVEENTDGRLASVHEILPTYL